MRGQRSCERTACGPAGPIYNNTSDQALPIALGADARQSGSRHDLGRVHQRPRLTGEGLARFLDENLGRRLSVSFMANQVPLQTNRIELHPIVKDKWGRPVAYIIKDWHSHDVHLMDTCWRTSAGKCS